MFFLILFLSFLKHALISVDCNPLVRSLFVQFWIDFIVNDKIFKCLCKFVLFHLNDFLDKTAFAENSGEFSLIHNEVHSLDTHCIVETNIGDLVVHACQHSCQPFLSITRPNTAEAPLLILSLVCGTKVQFH